MKNSAIRTTLRLTREFDTTLAPTKPICNTGVPTPNLICTRPVGLIDWYGTTRHTDDPDRVAHEEMARFFPHDVWAKTRLNGYEFGAQRDGVRVLWSQAPGTVHVEITGGGCRTLESRGIIKDWPSFIGGRISDGAQHTRIDVATDDRSGLLTMPRIHAHAERGLFVSTSRRHHAEREFDKTAGNLPISDGHVFGSRKSLVLVRLYDKALEQHVEGPWVRCELQCRNQRAQLVASAIAEQGMALIPAIIRAHLDFTVAGKSPRRDRRKSAPWWTEFLGNVSKAKLGTQPQDVALDRTNAHVRRNARCFALYHAQFGMGGLDDVLELGYSRLGQTYRRTG